MSKIYIRYWVPHKFTPIPWFLNYHEQIRRLRCLYCWFKGSWAFPHIHIPSRTSFFILSCKWRPVPTLHKDPTEAQKPAFLAYINSDSFVLIYHTGNKSLELIRKHQVPGCMATGPPANVWRVRDSGYGWVTTPRYGPTNWVTHA